MTLVETIDIKLIKPNMVVLYCITPTQRAYNPFYHIGLIRSTDINKGTINMMWLNNPKRECKDELHLYKNDDNSNKPNSWLPIYKIDIPMSRFNTYFNLFNPIGTYHDIS